MIGSLAANVRKFIDAIEKPVLILDSDFIVIAVNKYCDEHFRKGEEITGKWWEIDNKYEYIKLCQLKTDNRCHGVGRGLAPYYL